MPEIPCHIRRDAIQTWLNELTAQAQSMHDRAAAGLSAMSDITGYCASDVTDPADCCTRALSEVVATQTWMAGFDTVVADKTETATTLINNIDCSNADMWRHQATGAENATEQLSWYLASKDQELRTAAAIWEQLFYDCPIPIPQGSPRA